MKKYKFEQKLTEAVITGTDRQCVSVLIDGEERKARCHLLWNMEEGTPCLVSYGNNGYMVEAVSFYAGNQTDKEWFCINPLLFEHAVCYFLENHYMEDMTGDHGNVSRLSDTRDSGFDIETENAGIEVKVPLVIPNRTGSCAWKSFHQAVKQIIRYCSNSAVKEKSKRILLLTVCQHGTGQMQSMADGRIKDELKKAVSMGIECWIAETKTGPDGISLMSHQNFTDIMLND